MGEIYVKNVKFLINIRINYPEVTMTRTCFLPS